ncbi:hypothetical protein V8D89_014623 [Ganoderma adspersum]
MVRDSSPIPESSQESVDLLCHSQEREASAAMMAADDEALWKREKKQEADDGEWEPSSQKSIDEESSYTPSQESQESVDEEHLCVVFQESQRSVDEEYVSQSSATHSDDETVHGDKSLMLPPETGYPSKLTGRHVLFMAKARQDSIRRGKYGPVKIFLDKMTEHRAFHHFSREQLTIIYMFIIAHDELREYEGDRTPREETRWEKKLRMRWDALWEKRYGDDARL